MPGDPTATTPPPQHVCVGRLGRAYQLDGGMRLQLERGVAAAALGPADRLFVVGYGLAAVRALRPHGGGLILYLEGVRDREAARALVGAEVHAPAAVLADAAADAARLGDTDAAHVEALVGREVRLGERVIGRVREVRPSGGNPLLVVDAGTREVLLPLAAPYVRAGPSDIQLVDPPDGLLGP
ncbi:MAG TPA: hypothetical protein VKA00_05615, partial [Trueperaceae bacterium]|nr:hypothetical protein [Trueperaceae bacterium]